MSVFPFDYKHYVGALRAKAGEFKAVINLTTPQREHFSPLWELQPDDEDVPTQATTSAHLDRMAEQIHRAWGVDRAFADAELLDDGTMAGGGLHPLQYICDAAVARGAFLIPVTGLGYTAACSAAAVAVNAAHRSGIALRLLPSQASRAQAVAAFINENLRLTYAELDLIVDLEAVSEETLGLIMPFLPATLNALAAMGDWRTFTLLMGSFPEHLSGQGHLIFPRPEWPAWRDLITAPAVPLARNPAHGDYAVSHPHFVELPPFVAAAANIRYTGEQEWHIFRGRATTTIGRVIGYGYGQYFDLADNCRNTVPPYRGSAYSSGDKYTEDCANHAVTSGNNMIWRFVGTNQHIVYETSLALSVP